MILDEIVSHTSIYVEERKVAIPLEKIKEKIAEAPMPRSFEEALLRSSGEISIIAEIKKASPSAGIIRNDFNPVELACTYEAGGASAVSVLTEEKFFHGSLEILREVRNEITIPVLRKDFIIDPYQVYEARAAGADAILLIAAILDAGRLNELYQLAHELNMDVLFEIYNEEDLLKGMTVKPRIVGINNRNLATFKVDLTHTENLRSMIRFDYQCLVSESGIHTPEDIAYLRKVGVHAVLVGEALMKQSDPGRGVRELLEGGRKEQ